jgi:hypothetical protein
MTVQFTLHAQRQLVERDLDRTWVEAVLAFPEWTEPDPRHAGRWRAYRKVPERDDRVLRVVYEIVGPDTVVVSAFLDRTAERRRPKGAP